MLRITTEYFGIFQNHSFSPPPAGGVSGFFSDIHCENLIELQEVTLTKVEGKLITGVFISQAFHAEPLDIYHSSGFPTPELIPMKVSASL